MRKFYCVLTIVLCAVFGHSNVIAQCEEYASPVFNFANSNVGEVLCDGAEGCDAGGFEITGFEVWINEAYLMGALYPGAEYVFDICESYDENNWRAELTAVEYIDGDTPTAVSGAVMGTVQDCQLVFTVPDSYTQPVNVMVIISEVGNCGGDLGQIDNGFPFFGCGTNGGQPSCDGTELSCSDSSITPGTMFFNDDNICFNDTLFFNSDAPVAPMEGDVSGFSWLISTEDISGNADPLNSGFVVGGYPVLEASDDVFIFINDGGFDADTYYFTPVVFGNGAGNPNDAIFNITLAPSCTFVGQSTAINILGEDDVLCADCDPPMIEIFSSECDEQGLFELEVDVTFGSASSYTVVDSLNGYSQVLTSEGTVVFGPYEGGEVPIWIVGDANPACNVNRLVADFCPVLCDVISDGGFEEGSNIWVEFEEPNQPDFGIIDGTIPMTGSLSAYLGGFQTQQITNISQVINIPNTSSATLTFYGLFFCSDNNDNFKVLIDNETILDITGSDLEICESEIFTRFELDVSQFADGNAHTLQFSLFGTDAGFTAFFLDDVQLNACSCAAFAGSLRIPDETTFCSDTVSGVIAGTDLTEYIGPLSLYTFLLVDESGNIAMRVFDGNADYSNLESGDYTVYGLSFLTNGLEIIEELNTLEELQNRIDFGSLCADLTNNSYMVSYDANYVNIENPETQTDFAIESLRTLDAQSLEVKITAEKQMDLQWMIYNVNGQLLEEEKMRASLGENTLEVALPPMATGVYLMVLSDGKSRISERFVVLGF